MKITKEQQEGQKLLQTLFTKAWENDTFKKELINNPSEAIIKTTGKDLQLGSDTKLVVEDQMDTNIIYLNIPRKLNLEELELTDEQLEIVAGGETFVAAGLFVAGFAAGVALYAAVK